MQQEAVADERPPVEDRFLRGALRRAFVAIEQAYGTHLPWGIRTGLGSLDAKLAGALGPGSLVVIGGAPSVGKTSLASQIALGAAQQRVPVLFVSLQQNELMATLRLVAAESGVDAEAMRTGGITDQNWPKIAKAVETLSRMPLTIDDQSCTIRDIRATCIKHQEDYGLGLVVIDGLREVLPQDLDLLQTEEGAPWLLTDLREIARRLTLSMVVTVPTKTRPASQRTDKRPLLADFDDGGSVEDNADLALLLYRDDMYSSSLPDACDWMTDSIELLIAKNRCGTAGETVYLDFCQKTGQVRDYGQIFDRKPAAAPG